MTESRTVKLYKIFYTYIYTTMYIKSQIKNKKGGGIQLKTKWQTRLKLEKKKIDTLFNI